MTDDEIKRLAGVSRARHSDIAPAMRKYLMEKRRGLIVEIDALEVLLGVRRRRRKAAEKT